MSRSLQSKDLIPEKSEIYSIPTHIHGSRACTAFKSNLKDWSLNKHLLGPMTGPFQCNQISF